MRTARTLTVSPSMLCLGGVCSRGCVPGVFASGGVCSRRVSAPGGCLLRGVCLLPEGLLLGGGGGIPACSEADPLWTEWQTGAKILPCPKLRFRAVIMYLKFWEVWQTQLRQRLRPYYVIRPDVTRSCINCFWYIHNCFTLLFIKQSSD